MKLPIQGHPIARKISTTKIIGAKGIVQNGNPLPSCFACLRNCKGLRGDIRTMACLVGCSPICAEAGIDNVLKIFKDL